MPTAEELNKAGMEAYKAGNFPEAVAAYEQAVQLKPDYAPCYINLTLACIKLGRLDEAISSAQKAVALAPQAGAPHYYLGNAFVAKGRWNEAVSQYVRAFEIDKAQAGGLVIAAHLCMDNGLGPKAAELCRQFLAAAPPDHPKRQDAEQLLQEAEGGSSLISKF